MWLIHTMENDVAQLALQNVLPWVARNSFLPERAKSQDLIYGSLKKKKGFTSSLFGLLLSCFCSKRKRLRYTTECVHFYLSLEHSALQGLLQPVWEHVIKCYPLHYPAQPPQVARARANFHTNVHTHNSLSLLASFLYCACGKRGELDAFFNSIQFHQIGGHFRSSVFLGQNQYQFFSMYIHRILHYGRSVFSCIRVLLFWQ